MVKQFLEYVIKSIVNDQSAVSIDESLDQGVLTFKIRVKQDDRGRLIGREGRTIRSLRVLMQSILDKDGCTCSIDIVE